MTVYIDEPKKGEKIRTYGIQIRHDGQFYYAAVFPCILENDGNPAGYMVTELTLSACKAIAENRLNKKTIAKMNQTLIDFKDHLKHFTDPKSLAREAAHICM